MKSFKVVLLVSVLVALIFTANANANIDIPVAGLWAVGEDGLATIDDPTVPGTQLLHSWQTTPTHDPLAIEYVMDLGRIVPLAAVGIQNRCTYSSLNPNFAKVYVAADESAPGFNPADVNSFTIQINVSSPLGDTFSGDALNADVKRYIDVATHARRYVLVKVIGNAVGQLDEYPSGTNYLMQFQDVLASEAEGFWAVGGDAYATIDDPAAPGKPLRHCWQTAPTHDPLAFEYVMNLGSVVQLGAIGIQNRGVYSSLNPHTAKIYVAADESVLGFDPTDVNNFTIQINASSPLADTFGGSAMDADLKRYIRVALGYARKYVLVKVITNTSGQLDEYPSGTNYLVQFQNVLFSPERYVTGGRLFGLPDAIYYPEYPETTDFADIADHPAYPGTQLVRMVYNGGPTGDQTADIVMDQLVSKDIQQVRLTNTEGAASILNLNTLSMWVAPASGPGSESDPAFDKMNKSSYSVQIFPQVGSGEGTFTPSFYSAGTERLADVTDVSRRYILMSIKSNFWGNMGIGDGQWYNYYCDGSDISVLGADSISLCSDVFDLGLSLTSDVCEDCYVNVLDLGKLSEEWLASTEPGQAGSVQVAGGTPTYAIIPVPVGGITVNGSLSDWPTDSEWILLDKNYSGLSLPSDIVGYARCSMRWDDSSNKIYVAVVVTDSNHHFVDVPGTSYTDSDRIEIYSQGNIAGGIDWGAAETGTKYFNVAQQYIVGLKTLSTGGRWAVWGDLTNVDPTALESAVVVTGNQIIYEAAVKQYTNYGGKGGGVTTVTDLNVGTQIGFDVVVGTLSTASGYSSLAENTFTGKSNDAGQFQQYVLANSLPQQSCGDWGYLSSDIMPDCRVDMKDFAQMALQWLNCNDPQDPLCAHNW